MHGSCMALWLQGAATRAGLARARHVPRACGEHRMRDYGGRPTLVMRSEGSHGGGGVPGVLGMA